MFRRERNIYGNKSFDLIWVELFYLSHIFFGQGPRGASERDDWCLYCTVQFTLIIFGCNILITINYIIVITNILTVMSANDDLKQTKGEDGRINCVATNCQRMHFSDRDY